MEGKHLIILNESDGDCFKVGLKCLEFWEYREYAKFTFRNEYKERQYRSALNYARNLAKFLGLPLKDEVKPRKKKSK